MSFTFLRKLYYVTTYYNFQCNCPLQLIFFFNDYNNETLILEKINYLYLKIKNNIVKYSIKNLFKCLTYNIIHVWHFKKLLLCKLEMNKTPIIVQK